MKPSERFYNLAMPVWQTYFDHPFVKGIGDGTLEKDKFRYYMIQDHKYLMQYAKVFALGLVKATDEGDMRMYSDLIRATLDTENAVHQAYLKELDVTPEAIAATPMALNNKSYTDYMIAQVSKGGLPEIAVAVLACSWSYKVIGDHLSEMNTREGNSFYTRWIDMYSSPEYRQANDDMIALVDRYCSGLSEERLKHLDDILLDCIYYEYQFWDMAWSKGETYTPVPHAESR
ncbi:MAG TPA: thiaminase II [Coriobacteriaceae bacterium]|nr:thiaminase II [Coriobacteriaceae bacterium]